MVLICQSPSIAELTLTIVIVAPHAALATVATGVARAQLAAAVGRLVTHHLIAVGAVTATCCRVQEQLHVAMLHVGLVLGHRRDSILVCGELHVGLPGHPAIWTDFNMDPHRIQGGEEVVNVRLCGSVWKAPHVNTVACCALEGGATVAIAPV